MRRTADPAKPPTARWLAIVLEVARLLSAAQGQIAALQARGRRVITELEAEVQRLRIENELLRKRISRLPAPHRPRYSPWERLQILWHQARHGLSLRETAKRFAVQASTVAAWLRKLTDAPPGGRGKPHGRAALATAIGQLVRPLRWENTTWGTRRIAQALARLGAKVSRSSVQRIVRAKPPRPTPPPVTQETRAQRRRRTKKRRVVAKRPDHVWLIDITVVKLLFGLRHVHVGAVLDAFTRRVVALDTADQEPGAAWMCALLGRAVRSAGRAPKHLVTDRGVQFTSVEFGAASGRHGIRRRFGAVGTHGSIALIERFWRTLKYEALPLWSTFLTRERLHRRLLRWIRWYAAERAHQGIAGRTPHEQCSRRQRNATPRVLDLRAAGQWSLERSDFEGDRTLPVYRLRKVA